VTIEPVAALAAEAERTGAFLEDLGSNDWHLPTRCPPMNVRELVVHALRGAYRVLAFLEAPADGQPEKDAVTYYRYDARAVGPEVVERARAESSKRAADADIAAEWRDAWTDAIHAARAASEDDPLLVSPFGTIRLREYLRTRCVEVSVHAMDIRHACGLEPNPTPEGLEVACDVLRGLLGADLRPLGVDDVRFALTGTGRAPLTNAEREKLGPLSDSFPLLQ